MLRGKTLFICDECGNKFRDLDFEYMASVLTTPMKCPKCGSYHTYPATASAFIQKSVYKKIWEQIDKEE